MGDDIDVRLDWRRGVDVKPSSAGAPEFKLHTPHLFIEADPTTFVIRDLHDRANEPTLIPAIRGGKRDVPKIYRWLQANRPRVEQMTFSELERALRAKDSGRITTWRWIEKGTDDGLDLQNHARRHRGSQRRVVRHQCAQWTQRGGRRTRRARPS
jgi:hypothetical protein